MNFPKAEAVTDITQLATRFRAAAEQLDAIATRAPSLEVGTLRREANAVRVQVANAITNESEES